MAEEKKTLTRSELEIIIKRRAAVLLIILAALVAVNSFFKDGNSGRIMKDIIAANNQWAWYQAKNVRAAIYKTTADLVEDKKLAQHYHGEAQRMQEDMEAIKAKYDISSNGFLPEVCVENLPESLYHVSYIIANIHSDNLRGLVDENHTNPDISELTLAERRKKRAEFVKKKKDIQPIPISPHLVHPLCLFRMHVPYQGILYRFSEHHLVLCKLSIHGFLSSTVLPQLYGR